MESDFLEDFNWIKIKQQFMGENYGSLLDKHDISNAQSMAGQDLFGKEIGELSRRCFGNVISRMLEGKTTTLSGQTGTAHTDVAPFLYFYDYLILDICPGCPQALDPKQLEPFLERKMMIVRTRSNFEHYFPDFQELAFRYKEFFIGSESMVTFKHFRLNDLPPHNPQVSACPICSLRKKLEPYHEKTAKFSRPKRTMLRSYLREIEELPISNGTHLADLFIKTMKNPTKNRMRELESTVNLTSYLTSVESMKSTPQFLSNFIDIPDLFLKSLRINHQQNMDLDQYVDVVKDFKGTLSPAMLPKDEDQILSKVQIINEEIDKIEYSKRGKISSFISTFLTDIPLVLSGIAKTGTYGAEGIVQKALQGYRSPSLSTIRSKILSKYYGISESGAQIWQIRKALDNKK